MASGSSKSGGRGGKAGSGKKTAAKERRARQLAKFREAAAGAPF